MSKYDDWDNTVGKVFYSSSNSSTTCNRDSINPFDSLDDSLKIDNNEDDETYYAEVDIIDEKKNQNRKKRKNTESDGISKKKITINKIKYQGNTYESISVANISCFVTILNGVVDIKEQLDTEQLT